MADAAAHPPYSPDISPCDFDLFPKLKNTYRGRKFHDLDELFREIVRQADRLARTGAAKTLGARHGNEGKLL
jgi:hypothetical protein